jgi:hypothetical protein
MKRVWLIVFCQFKGPGPDYSTLAVDIQAFDTEAARDAGYERARGIAAYGVRLFKTDAPIEGVQ